MSFFVKSNGLSKNLTGKKRKRRVEKAPKKNVEISSSEDESINDANEADAFDLSEDENETAQEKKLRLAKTYLEEIEREERRRLEDKEITRDILSQRLKDDYLKQTGKYEAKVASNYTNLDKCTVKTLKCREQRNSVTCVCISSNNEWIFSGSKCGVVVKWSIDGKKLGVIPFVRENSGAVAGHTGRITAMALSSDNKYLAVTDSSRLIYIWNPDTLEYINILKGHTRPDRSVRVWSLDEMAFVETLFGHQNEITAIDAMHSDRPVTAGGRDGTVRLWKVAEESQLIYNSAPESVDAIKLINEQYFVTGGDNGQLCVWSNLKKKPIQVVKAAHGCDPSNKQPYWISAVAALPHTDLIASGSQDGVIRLWKLDDKYRTVINLFEVPATGFVNSLAFTSDGKYLVAAIGKDHRLGRWSVVKSAKNCVMLIQLK